MALTDLFESHQTGVAQVLLARGGRLVSSGSAFLVEGGLVTNSHVIRPPADQIGVRFSDMDFGAPVSWSSADFLDAVKVESPVDEWDVAFVKVDDGAFKGRHRFDFAPDSNVRVGQQLAFMGYPFTMPNITFHAGHVSSRIAGDIDVIQLDASINGGNSGGPLLEPDSGQVVGVVTRAHIGFVAEQFDKLIEQLDQNVQILQNQKSMMSIGGVDPVKAIAASQAAMAQIAKSLRSSANVGIGYANSSSFIAEQLAG